jgi:SAM-dependent methyltransferase
MNLFDLVKRPDRAVQNRGPLARAEPVALRSGAQRAVVIAPGAVLQISDAHELTTLWRISTDLGWSVLRRQGAVVFPSMRLLVRHPLTAQFPIGLTAGPGDEESVGLRVTWPEQIVAADRFDLEIENRDSAPLTLLCGPLMDMRRLLMPHARGVGVEVGPGLRPLVLPGPGVHVTYLEQQDPHEWLNLYNKTGDKPTLPAPHVLERYVRGSAVTLDCVKSGSLDFVFSNHVFEHLPNPLQVLRNWQQSLRPGGMILGVVPDPRFTFDCRQAPTTLLEAIDEEAAGGHEITAGKYERWCRYTEPRHTPHDLQRRGYSIHVNFFTPESFTSAMHALQERGWFDRVFVHTATNHKDFGFALRRAS